MSDTLFDLTQYQSQAHINYSPDWRDATGTDPAWEHPVLELDLGANSQGPVDDAITQWRTGAEFTLTLQSGQTVEVTFVPCLVGKRRMHEFSFTGPVSPTGFKSHFVLALEAEEFPHPRDYAQAYAEEIFARFEAGQEQQAKSKKRSRPMAESQTPQGQESDNDSSRQETTMAADETDVLNYPRVEVVDELSEEEEADRQRLELKVERAFYEAGVSLRELRERRLYRASHKTFEEYCRDRFGFSRQNANYFIAGAGVVDNLLCLTKNLCQTLPTKFEHVRHLTSLDPDEQCQVWQEAVVAAGGKVPSGRVVRGIVERLKERDTTPPQIPFRKGDVVLIRGLGNPELKRYDGQWALALAINEYSITIGLDAKDIPVKPQFLEPVEPKYWADIKAVNERITRLQQYELDPMESAGLEVLRRRTCFTPKQITLLKRMENDYGVI